MEKQTIGERGCGIMKLKVLEGGLSKHPGRQTIKTFEGPHNDSDFLVDMINKLKKIYHSDYSDLKEKVYGWLSAGSVEIDRRRANMQGSAKKPHVCRSPEEERREKDEKLKFIFTEGTPHQKVVLFGVIDILNQRIKEEQAREGYGL